MNNSKFWGAGSNGNAVTKTEGNPDKSINKTGKIVKKLSVTGIIVLVLVVVVLGIGYLFVGRPALALLSSAKLLSADKDALAGAVQNRDMVALDKVLIKTEKDLGDLRTARDQKFGWAKNIKLFKVKEYYSDSDRFINAGLYSIDAIREMEKVMLPFADAAGLKVRPDQQVPESKGLMEAFQSWVSIMPEVAGQMDGVIAKVAKVGDELAPINVDKYPESIRGFPIRSNISFIKDTLSKADDYAPDVKQALLILPKILGVGTPTKRYMVIMQNDKEIRATGGFMTNYATFKIQNALLQSDFTSKDMYSIDQTLDIIDPVYTFPRPPLSYTKYLKVERWYARDMNYSPDFTTSMDQFMIFYNMAGRISPYEIKPVDGIFSIDTEVVKGLLDVTGPVTLDGVTYTSDNVVLELEKIASLALREQANRKGVLGRVMQAMLINVFESDKNLWPVLINRAVQLANEKHIQAYIFDPEIQALVQKYGFGGRITDPVTGDYSMVVSTNLGGDKTNWFVHKDIQESVTKSGNRWLKTVTVKYTYPQPGADYSPFVAGFKDWLRVYAPAGSEFVSVDGSEDGTTTDTERGKVWFSGYVQLAPDQTKTMTFKYYLPNSVVVGPTYNLTLQKQAGIDQEHYTISVAGKSKELQLRKDSQVSIKL